ncbi:hypothetical protein [Bosea sp. LjRoot237]|uniref:hypothetical protein n=1 Tax=Bosea sp. LjRoot237 TaxID=3342292 RepID=UPI003ECCCE8F
MAAAVATAPERSCSLAFSERWGRAATLDAVPGPSAESARLRTMVQRRLPKGCGACDSEFGARCASQDGVALASRDICSGSIADHERRLLRNHLQPIEEKPTEQNSNRKIVFRWHLLEIDNIGGFGGRFVPAMNYRRVLLWSFAAGLGAALLVGNPWLIRPQSPSGPIADVLSSIEHIKGKQVETSALADVLPNSPVLRWGGKPAGVTPPFVMALKSANFSCEMMIDVDGQPRLYACRNSYAGKTLEGCRRSWLLVFELPPKNIGLTANYPTKRQAFVRAIC